MLPTRQSLKNISKGELFKNRKNYQSARSTIRRKAFEAYMASQEYPKCKNCGYTNHIEVAHIKSVSEFPSSSLLSEINAMDNLIGLCPNCHWEYDNGLLNL